MGRRVIELQLEVQPLLPASPSTYSLRSCYKGIQPFDTNMKVICKCVRLHLMFMHLCIMLSSIVCAARLAYIDLPTPARWQKLVETLLVLLPVTNVNGNHNESTPAQNRDCAQTVYKAV